MALLKTLKTRNTTYAERPIPMFYRFTQKHLLKPIWNTWLEAVCMWLENEFSEYTKKIEEKQKYDKKAFSSWNYSTHTARESEEN